MNELEARLEGEKMARKLGEDWIVKVWENMDWHYSVRSPGDTIIVFGGEGGYTALISEPGNSYGQMGLSGQGKTPRKAVEDTVALTRAEIEKLERWLEGVR